MSQVPFTIPIESIDFKELRKRTRRLRDEADAAQEEPDFAAEIRRQGFRRPTVVPTAQPVPTPRDPSRAVISPPEVQRRFEAQPRSPNLAADLGLGFAQTLGGLAEPVVQPLDVFAQTASELVRGEKPTLFEEDGGYVASLDSFRNKSAKQQIFESVVFDPFIVFKAITVPAKLARSAIRVPIARAASGAREILPVISNNVIDLQPIQIGLGPLDEIENTVKALIPGQTPLKSNIATPAMLERSRVRNIIDSEANIIGAKAGERIKRLFNRDDAGGVIGLDGVDSSIVGNPTLQDIAARLPLYESKLTGDADSCS